jgi:oligopeptide transport system substrate-binding protein
MIAFSVLMVLAIGLAACQPAAPVVERVIETVVVEKEGQTVIVTQVVEKTVEVEVPVPAEPEAPQGKILLLTGGASDIPSLDPPHVTQAIEIQIVGATMMGLVRQNTETADLENGMAASYELSEDGLTYTVTLLDNVPWVKWDANNNEVVEVQNCDGETRYVTADDFKYGILRTLNPATAADYAYILTPYLVGAAEYNGAETTDPAELEALAAGVGVEVVDPQTIKYTFKEPGIYNLNLLGLWPAYAQPQWLIEGDDCTEARGDRWTEQGFYQGYGPFVLKEWVHDYYLTLAKNPFWPGTDSVPVAKLDEVRLTFLDVSTAFAEYEAGNLDIASIPSGDMDRVMADPAYADQVQDVIELGTEFYAFNVQLAPTDDARVRRALSMAIDRQSIVENVNKSGIPAPFFTNKGAAGAPKPEQYPDLGITYDPEGAKALLDEYLAETGQTAEELRITLLFNTTEMNKARAEAIQAMWKDALGVTVELINQERAVFLEMREQGNENIYRSSWVQDYPDANNFLFDTFAPGGGYADVVDWTEGEAYERFVELLRQAATETDPQARMELYAQAERIFVMEEAIVAPIYWYASPVLVKPHVMDTPSITGYDHWEKWDLAE